MVRRLAIIPARGGSKRLPRKNIADIAGKPLLGHVIDLVKSTNIFDEIIVSTEDQEIKAIAEEYDITIHERPVELAKDNVSVNQVCESILTEYKDVTNEDVFCIIYSTAILLSKETLEGALTELTEDTNFVMGVSNYNFPPVQALKEGGGGFLSYQWPEFIGKRSQLHPNLVVSNGSMYWGRISSFLSERTMCGSKTKGYLIPEYEVCDVDYPDDLKDLEKKYLINN